MRPPGTSTSYGLGGYGTAKIDARDPRMRHVVFVDRVIGRRRPLDLGPAAADEPPAAEPEGAQGPESASFLEWLLARGGLDARNYGAQTLIRRLPACLRMLRASGVQQARQALERQPLLVGPAVSVLVIGVTSFFRDEAVFDLLRRRVLPALASDRTGVRVWSAGCSDGQELYSVGMLVADLGLLPRVELLGTDCRGEAVSRARVGVYDAAGAKGLADPYRGRYVKPHPGGWQVVDSLRRAATWRTGDALSQPEPGQWDLILCRNMAMYLKPDAAARLWQRLEQALRPGGVLVLGKAERPYGARSLAAAGPCVYRREWAR